MTTRLASKSALATFVVLGVVAVAAPNFTAAGDGRAGSGAAVLTSVPPPDDGPQGPFCASIPPAGEGSFAGMANDPVAVAAGNNPYLTTLASAVAAAGFVDTLNGPGPFTIFAPSNEAFAEFPPSELDAILADTVNLTNLLTYHVVSGASLSAADLVAAGKVATVQGGELTFTAGADGSVSINGGAATMICADIITANATVHVIDHVLIAPAPELVEVL